MWISPVEKLNVVTHIGVSATSCIVDADVSKQEGFPEASVSHCNPVHKETILDWILHVIDIFYHKCMVK